MLRAVQRHDVRVAEVPVLAAVGPQAAGAGLLEEGSRPEGHHRGRQDDRERDPGGANPPGHYSPMIWYQNFCSRVGTWSTRTYFVWRYSRSPQGPNSRPMPDCL